MTWIVQDFQVQGNKRYLTGILRDSDDKYGFKAKICSQISQFGHSGQSGESTNANQLLQYWREKNEQWPNLAIVARDVLCVLACSTSSERVFSLTGRTLEDRRCFLSPESVDGLLFLLGLRTPK